MYFEEFVLGSTTQIKPAAIHKNDMIDFAKKYDNIPLHTNEEYAKSTIFGQLIAPGVMSFMSVWAKNGSDNGGVCLCAADEEMYINIFSAAGCANLASCGIADLVLAVAAVLLVVGIDQRAHDHVRRAAGIIAFKMKHSSFVLSKNRMGLSYAIRGRLSS